VNRHLGFHLAKKELPFVINRAAVVDGSVSEQREIAECGVQISTDKRKRTTKEKELSKGRRAMNKVEDE